jgi:uncharacterized protein YndB with AHSA1/START domain
MADIFHEFPIKAPIGKVFEAIANPSGLDNWWTKRASGKPELGAVYELWFGPDYDWRAVVSDCVLNSRFGLEMSQADEDWMGTRVEFILDEQDGVTLVKFSHTGWPSANEHHRISNFCWAMYLRLLKRYVEHGEVVAYEDRLEV